MMFDRHCVTSFSIGAVFIVVPYVPQSSGGMGNPRSTSKRKRRGKVPGASGGNVNAGSSNKQ